jgi:hypothetical protein
MILVQVPKIFLFEIGGFFATTLPRCMLFFSFCKRIAILASQEGGRQRCCDYWGEYSPFKTLLGEKRNRGKCVE